VDGVLLLMTDMILRRGRSAFSLLACTAKIFAGIVACCQCLDPASERLRL
jgi:hypothetical protein